MNKVLADPCIACIVGTHKQEESKVCVFVADQQNLEIIFFKGWQSLDCLVLQFSNYSSKQTKLVQHLKIISKRWKQRKKGEASSVKESQLIWN